MGGAGQTPGPIRSATDTRGRQEAGPVVVLGDAERAGWEQSPVSAEKWIDNQGIVAIRGLHSGVLRFGDRASPVRVVYDPRDGRVVLPIEASALRADELTLHMPDESDEALQALLRAREVDPEWDEGCDRWSAYHGRAVGTLWASCDVELLRADGRVYGGEEVMLENPLRANEGRLCGLLNRHSERLTVLCSRHDGIEVADPFAVGVDPLGVDVRARFGICRLCFERPARDADEAAERIAAMLGVGESP